MKFHKNLTDTECKNAEPRDKEYKLSDGGGLYLLVHPNGSKYWRYKYRLDGREKKGSLGVYPALSLADARKRHGAASEHVEDGNDPIEQRRKVETARKIEKAANRPFREVAQEWLDELIKPLLGHAAVYRYSLNVDTLNEAFGEVPVVDLDLPHLTPVLLGFQRAGKYETRRRVQQTAVKIMGMAKGRGYIKHNPFVGASFAEAFTNPESVRESRPAVTEPIAFGRLLADIERTADMNRRALRLLNLVMLRPGELAQLQWSSIVWDEAKLAVPFALLKMRTERIERKSPRAFKDFEVPLSRQAIVELKLLWAVTGDTPYLFPARHGQNKGKHITESTTNAALTRLGYQGIHCAHGFRSSASTMLNEERMIIEGKKVLRWPDQKALIEVQLDHDDASTQAIYDRGGRWEERCELMQLWADRTDEMRNARLLKLAA